MAKWSERSASLLSSVSESYRDAQVTTGFNDIKVSELLSRSLTVTGGRGVYYLV